MMYSLLSETKNCQICKKSFPNGRALGGHMRSHTQKLSLRCHTSESDAESASGSTIPPLKTSNRLRANFRSLETVLMRSVQTSEGVGGPKPDLSKKGGQQITTKRKIVMDLNKVNSIESQSCLTEEECAALCLISISKGKSSESCQKPKAINSLVSTRKGKDYVKYIEVDSEDDYEYVDEDEDEDEDEDVKILTSDVGILTEDSDEGDDENSYLVARAKKCKKQYKCDICGKVLRSYQALGGHRTSHRNKRLKICNKNDQAVKPENGLVVRRHFECQICNRVFESGQALGGHKKVHYSYLQPSK